MTFVNRNNDKAKFSIIRKSMKRPDQYLSHKLQMTNSTFSI